MEPYRQRSGLFLITVKLLVSALVCLALFLAGVMVTVKLNLMHYGPEAFNHDAGAAFGLVMEGGFVGLLFAVGGIALCVNRWSRS